MDDNAKAFLDDLRRLMTAQGARFTRCEDGNGWWWQVSVGDSTLDLSDDDRYISAPVDTTRKSNATIISKRGLRNI